MQKLNYDHRYNAKKAEWKTTVRYALLETQQRHWLITSEIMSLLLWIIARQLKGKIIC